MESSRISRLNTLFEKMVAEAANVSECSELKQLYSEYIDDGREERIKHSSTYNQTAIGIVSH